MSAGSVSILLPTMLLNVATSLSVTYIDISNYMQLTHRYPVPSLSKLITYILTSICDCLSIVCTKTEFNFIATVYRYTWYLFIYPQMLNVNWSAFRKAPKSWLEQWHQWRALIRWKLLPLLTDRLCGLLMWYGPFIVWTSIGIRLLQWYPNQGFLSFPTPPPALHSSTYPHCKLSWHKKRMEKFSQQWFRRLAIIKANR